MKRSVWLLFAVLVLVLTACGDSSGSSSETMTPDYTTASFEEALNAGEDLTGKTVLVEIEELIPDSAFGYNLVAGEHLNFVSDTHPKKEAGDEMIVEVKEVQSLLGSYIISYEEK